MVTSFAYGNLIFDPPPTNLFPLTDRQKIVKGDCRQPLPQYQIWCKSVQGMEGFSANLFIPSFSSWQIFTLGGSNDADSHKIVPFGVSLILLRI